MRRKMFIDPAKSEGETHEVVLRKERWGEHHDVYHYIPGNDSDPSNGMATYGGTALKLV